MPLFSSSDRMSDPRAFPSASNAGEDDAVWDQFAELLEELERLVARAEPITSFYQRLLAGCVEGLAAPGGVVLTRGPLGRFAPIATHGLDAGELAQRCAAYESVLTNAEHLRTPQTESLPEETITAASVSLDGPSQPEGSPHTAALVLLVQRPGLAPEYHRACERLLGAVVSIAADAHRRIETSELHTIAAWNQRLLQFAESISGTTDLEPTAYRVVNEGCELIGADRLSLVWVHHAKPRLLAVSGAESFDRRSGAARSLKHVASVALAEDGPIAWPSPAGSDHPACDQLDEYCDDSHARAVCLARVEAPRQAETHDECEAPTLAVLVADWFETPHSAPHDERLAELARASSPALHNASQWSNVPLARTLRALPRLARPGVVGALAGVAAMLALLVAVLVLVEVEHTVTLPGEIRPAEQRVLFAPSDALVDRVLVESGQQVVADEPVLMLSSPSLALESERLAGELAEVESQLRAVGAARAVGESRSATSIEALRLTSEEKRLQQRATALHAEIDLIEEQREALLVRSPVPGKVVTWRPAELLGARPVQRGQQLLTIAQHQSPWVLELHAPDDRIGLVLDARAKSETPLRVSYESLDGSGHVLWGQLSRIAPRADAAIVEASLGATVRLEVAPEDPLAPLGADAEAIPDSAVRARVYCGKRSLAYVWLHDAWSVVTRWWRL